MFWNEALKPNKQVIFYLKFKTRIFDIGDKVAIKLDGKNNLDENNEEDNLLIKEEIIRILSIQMFPTSIYRVKPNLRYSGKILEKVDDYTIKIYIENNGNMNTSGDDMWDGHVIWNKIKDNAFTNYKYSFDNEKYYDIEHDMFWNDGLKPNEQIIFYLKFEMKISKINDKLEIILDSDRNIDETNEKDNIINLEILLKKEK